MKVIFKMVYLFLEQYFNRINTWPNVHLQNNNNNNTENRKIKKIYKKNKKY